MLPRSRSITQTGIRTCSKVATKCPRSEQSWSPCLLVQEVVQQPIPVDPCFRSAARFPPNHNYRQCASSLPDKTRHRQRSGNLFTVVLIAEVVSHRQRMRSSLRQARQSCRHFQSSESSRDYPVSCVLYRCRFVAPYSSSLRLTCPSGEGTVRLRRTCGHQRFVGFWRCARSTLASDNYEVSACHSRLGPQAPPDFGARIPQLDKKRREPLLRCTQVQLPRATRHRRVQRSSRPVGGFRIVARRGEIRFCHGRHIHDLELDSLRAGDAEQLHRLIEYVDSSFAPALSKILHSTTMLLQRMPYPFTHYSIIGDYSDG